MRTQYRLKWKRAGRSERAKTFSGIPQLRRFLWLLGPEPWQAFETWKAGSRPDDAWCCGGWECSCGGETFRERVENRREELKLTPIQWIRIEARQVTAYHAIGCPDVALAAMADVALNPDALDAQYDQHAQLVGQP